MARPRLSPGYGTADVLEAVRRAASHLLVWRRGAMISGPSGFDADCFVAALTLVEDRTLPVVAAAVELGGKQKVAYHWSAGETAGDRDGALAHRVWPLHRQARVARSGGITLPALISPRCIGSGRVSRHSSGRRRDAGHFMATVSRRRWTIPVPSGRSRRP